MTDRDDGLERVPFSRRAILVGAVACTACRWSGDGPPPRSNVALREVAPVPIGCAISSRDVADAGFLRLLQRHFSQITPSFEMKMSLMVAGDGSVRFDVADKIVRFAKAHTLRLHGTTLVWYKYVPEAFKRLAANPAAFGVLYDSYIRTVTRRYRGQVAGWDVVNEPIEHRGTALRTSEWSTVLGPEDHIVRAFEIASAADPAAILFLNEYGLESRPDKRRAFLQLVERLLKRGAKIGGLGTQTHMTIDQPRDALFETMKELAAFGLPVHVSELDISFGHRKIELRSIEDRRRLQKERARDLVEAFLSIPPRQRYAITLWGLRDRDSWLAMAPYDGTDEPLAFGNDGTPKAMFDGLVDGFALKKDK